MTIGGRNLMFFFKKRPLMAYIWAEFDVFYRKPPGIQKCICSMIHK